MRLSKSILAMMLVLLVVSFSYAETVDSILAKMINAQGGEKAIKAIKSSISKGKLSIPMQGLEFPMTIYSKSPGKMRTDMEVMGSQTIQACDGTIAWMVNPMAGAMEPTEMTGEQAEMLKIRSSEDGFLFNLEKRGIKLEYVGDEDVAGESLHNLKYTLPGGMVINVFIDPTSGLNRLTKTTINEPTMGGAVEITIYFSDYRQVAGVLMPFRMEQSMAGMDMTMEFESIDVNVPIDDSLFSMPK